MKRKLLTVTFMLLAVAALGMSESSANTDLCQECFLQCVTDSNAVFFQCMAQGGSAITCDNQAIQYQRTCERLFCRYGGLCSAF